MFVSDHASASPPGSAHGRRTSELAHALDDLATALDVLAAVDTDREAGRDLLDAVATAERLTARLTSVQLGLLAGAQTWGSADGATP